MKILAEYVVAYVLTFLILDIARWVTEYQRSKKNGASCVLVFLWHDWIYKKIRFVVALLIILVIFIGGVYLILSGRASSPLLGVWSALVAWWGAGKLFDKWD